METSGRKQHKKKIILTSIAVGAAGVLGYFGWQFYKKRKSIKGASSSNYSDLDSLLKSSPSAPSDTLPVLSPSPVAVSKAKTKELPASITATAADSGEFPLHRGSKGEKVRALQKALIGKYGRNILPKYGADGDFGSETVTALRRVMLPTSVDESIFYVITQGGRSEGGAIGQELIKATDEHNFAAAMAALKKMTSTADYNSANNIYKTYYINGVRKTIVNGLLDTFSSDDQKQQIKFEFLRIGLQFNGSKWSLSGLGGLPIITVRPATVWMNTQRRVQVPARVVLGNEVSKRLDYTLFENQGQYFLVPTHCVRYI